MSFSPTPSHHLPSPHPVLHDAAVAKKKKKKRHRDEAADPQDPDTGAGDQPKKKTKRHKGIPPEGHAVPIDPSLVPSESIDNPLAKKKKLKKKDKGKQPAAPSHSVEEPEPPQIDSGLTDADQSTAALIQAIIAAASNASDLPPAQPIEALPLHTDAQMMLDPSQHFIPYPFLPYGIAGAHDMPQNTEPHATFFPPAPTAPFSELSFASNEDVLRALQALDMSKITSVLKGLSEGTSNPDDLPSGPHPTPLRQMSAASRDILALYEHNPQKPKRTLDMTLPGTEHHTTPSHAYLLANKWLNANKLAELVKTEGLVYKKGKFSAIEEQQLTVAVENYRITRGLGESQVRELIFPQAGKDKDNAFWSEITAAVPQRPIIAVYHHVRRTYHPMKQKGKWRPEEDALLKQAVTDLGQQWEKVSKVVDRMSSDCRDRYRNHIQNREQRVSGPWTKEEEEELTRIVTDMTVKQGRDIDNDVFWGKVSDLMGGKRGRQQCRIKWTDALSKTVKNEGQKPRWSQQDAYILVHKVDSLNVRDDTEIDWKTIPDLQWNLWSAHTLQRRWLTMKRGIKGHEDMTHAEIMDILRVKKAQYPAPLPVAPRKRKERKVSSAADVTEEPSGAGETSASKAPEGTHGHGDADSSGLDSDDTTELDELDE